MSSDERQSPAMTSSKLPQNARVPLAQHPKQQAFSAMPVDIVSPSSSRPRETSHSYDARVSLMLASSPGSVFSAGTGTHLPGIQSASVAGDDNDSILSLSRRQAAGLERGEVARRLKHHLVTRPASSYVAESGRNNQGQLARSFNSTTKSGPAAGVPAGVRVLPAASSQPQSPAIHPDDSGYAGDVNEDECFYSNTSPPPGDDAQVHGEEVVVNPLLLPSGDITHQIYRWQSKNEAPVHESGYGAAITSHPESVAAATGDNCEHRNSGTRCVLPRRRSFSALESDSEWDIQFRPGNINVPGGFRRQFVRERAERQGREPPGIIAESFVDFIALYGHFAGGDYLSDEDKEYFGYEQNEYAAEENTVPDERTPLRRVPSNLHGTASSKKAFFLLIKAFVGTGVLVLPRAFYNGGLLSACVLMILVGWYAWHCILLLAEVYLKIGGGSYSDIGLRLYGRWMQFAVTSSIVLAQIGACCAYTIFVAQNWRNVFNTISGCHMQLSTEFWVLVQALVFVPLALIRQIRYFAPMALLANVLIIGSLAYLLGFDVWSIAENGPAEVVNYNPVRFPLLVGTAVYSFEGVTLVIPILESLRDQRSFGRVLTLAISLCMVLFLCVGSLSYLTFGSNVEAVVLLNLPNTSSWTLMAQLLYSVAILFSMPLQLFPAVRIMEAMMFTRSGRDFKSVKWQKNMFRAITALFISLIAIFGVDQLDNVVSLVGSFCLVPLSFIYPSSMHLKAVAQSRWVRFKDIVLIIIGIVAMVYVTYISVITWGTSEPPLDVCASGP
ncbi:hypothetical protein COEREDRAFT_79072 [Coemansia reversa NRRL 1564]|uniref:Amino acid transporter transmembrane domain-containing protein n=1 Tax=Coemansia reversa (strain ATCC 12441 / NRRL 1564) TaxID=763665 RepID=A0A2G5BJ92_COERN|nr:hypothetical protein COEREDRAFT_79072 [Coemansia reversa NRRL 1564]|eukprot:PIA19090.1 hypothetical protein COEREDRAFT_79072 [Coemansia reversa NRRL 1564]